MKVVVGLGATGLSCVEYLARTGHTVVAMDSAAYPLAVETLRAKFPDVQCCVGGLNQALLNQAEEIVVSPGVPTTLKEIQHAKNNNIPVIGDVELFARVYESPLYAVTGSNGKTTVTTLVGDMARKANKNIITAGNIGKPVLSLLNGETFEGCVLELSSFQLETTESLCTKAAVVLNVTADHLDRYDDFEAYRQAKLKIYHQCELPIINLDEPMAWHGVPLNDEVLTVSVQNERAHYSVRAERGNLYLTGHGKHLVNVLELPLQGEHHWQNALCALAMGEVMGLPLAARLEVLRQFRGLPHRCQLVQIKNRVAWYNDSKGTNVGATKAALQCLAKQVKGKLILIAGGMAKDSDFSPLSELVKHHVSCLVLFGQDKDLIAKSLATTTSIQRVSTLSDAVSFASQAAHSGDAVVLSPACASFDMFLNYEDRGKQFIALVEQL